MREWRLRNSEVPHGRRVTGPYSCTSIPSCSSIATSVIKDEPVETTVEPVAVAPTVEQPKPAEPEIPRFPRDQYFTADSIGRSYNANELAAESRFKGQMMPVTGVVDSVSSDIFGTLYVSLAAENLLGVQCFFPEEMKDSLKKLNKGSTLFVYGECQGKTIGIVIFKNCQFSPPLN